MRGKTITLNVYVTTTRGGGSSLVIDDGVNKYTIYLDDNTQLTLAKAVLLSNSNQTQFAAVKEVKK